MKGGEALNNRKKNKEGELDSVYSLLKIYNMNAEDMLKKITDEMPGGFFVYRAGGDEEIIYANMAMLRIFECDTMEEFVELTGNSFRGIVHPDDLEEVEQSIRYQIQESHYDLDYVEYRIVTKYGNVRWVEDYGHFIHSGIVGDIFYVFVSDATERLQQQEAEKEELLSEQLQKEEILKQRIEEYDKELEVVNQEQLRHMNVIEGLSMDYESIFYANLDENRIQTYRHSDRIEYQFGGGRWLCEFEGFDAEYIQTWVHPEDRWIVEEATNPDYIRERLSETGMYYINYRIIKDGKVEYLQLRVVNVGPAEQVSEIVMGYRSVDDEIRREMMQKNLVEDALGRAEEANAAKDAFLANMSHDMRTPMNAIVGFTSLAKRYIDDRDKVWEYLNKIEESGEHLLNLINDVLEISKMDTTEVNLEEEECNIRACVEEVHEAILPKANTKNITILLDVSGVKHCEVYSDPEKLNQVLWRLGSNAVQYTEDGGRIQVTVKELEGTENDYVSYQFVVEDNGIGMSESFQERMFEPFERQKNTTMSRIHGTGLGLTIAKRIVDLMNGSIEVNSVEGEGSRFTVTLDFRIRQEGMHQSEMKKKSSVDAAQEYKVLLVEDNEINMELEVELLRDEGFRVDTATDGSIAVEMVRNSRPGEYAVILMDIQMPVMDGYHAAQAIRSLKNPSLARIPIIAVSANAFEEDRRKALECGMNAHVAKPVDITQLLSAISSTLYNAGS